jgi:UDP-N-acetylglucosamine 2-epimerase (non-hydrolysing)
VARNGTVFVVLGTRPEAIKLAPVIGALRRDGELQPIVVATSQHREMLRQALRPFGLVPDLDLDVMTEGQTPTAVAAAVLDRLEPLLQTHRPLWTVVQGDTTSTLAASIASFYAGIPLAHVEAGLRTGRLDAPFPEEFNRRGVAVGASLHCAPTVRAADNLRREGVPDERIVVVGNTVVDAVREIVATVPSVRGDGRSLVLVTLHRRESFGAPLQRLLGALRELAEESGGRVRFVLPVHPNPRVRGPVRELLGGAPGVELRDPLDYPEFLALFRDALFVMTDSGGVQEEAPSLGVPVLVLRETTERPEVVESGWGKVVGTDPERLLAEARRLRDDPAARAQMTSGPNPFGDGHSGERIARLLLERATGVVR